MSRILPVVLALLVLPALPAAAQQAAPAAQQTAPAVGGDEVLVNAAQLERHGEERVIVGEGAVVVRHRDLRLAADRVVYNELTRDLVADGNVVLDAGADRLQGEHLELNLGTRIGFVEHGQGFVQSYYFTGRRIEKQGPDRYVVRGGTFTTCEGVLPDWSFHTTTADVTIDEYLHAWNPSLFVKRLPVLYFPYAVFPVKRDRSSGLLIPEIRYSNRDGVILREAYYWAPRDNFDATVGLDYLQKTGWGANGEVRYLLGLRTQGVLNAYYLQEDGGTGTGAERWSFSTRNSHELPLGLQLEAEAFFQSDRSFRANYADTIEKRSDERTTTSVYLRRSWSAWDFTLSGRHEESLITEQRNTLTRFPELTVDRTSTRLFDTDLLLRLDASGVRLRRDNASGEFATTRLHLVPELTWPLSLGSVARVIPAATYDVAYYSRDLDGQEATRQVPTGRVTLEGPRFYRVWDVEQRGIEKVKHLIEPSIGYVYTPSVDQSRMPKFDSIDRIEPASRLEYSLTNTLYAKVRERRATAAAARAAAAPETAGGASGGGGAGASVPASAEEMPA
ncbi:MAG TPA: LPS assembly protein LptD, partial [bacterium]